MQGWAGLLEIVVVEEVVKGGFLIENGEIQSSNGSLLQHNHRCENKPKSVVVVQPICGNRILGTDEAGI